MKNFSRRHFLSSLPMTIPLLKGCSQIELINHKGPTNFIGPVHNKKKSGVLFNSFSNKAFQKDTESFYQTSDAIHTTLSYFIGSTKRDLFVPQMGQAFYILNDHQIRKQLIDKQIYLSGYASYNEKAQELYFSASLKHSDLAVLLIYNAKNLEFKKTIILNEYGVHYLKFQNKKLLIFTSGLKSSSLNPKLSVNEDKFTSKILTFNPSKRIIETKIDLPEQKSCIKVIANNTSYLLAMKDYSLNKDEVLLYQHEQNKKLKSLPITSEVKALSMNDNSTKALIASSDKLQLWDLDNANIVDEKIYNKACGLNYFHGNDSFYLSSTQGELFQIQYNHNRLITFRIKKCDYFFGQHFKIS